MTPGPGRDLSRAQGVICRLPARRAARFPVVVTCEHGGNNVPKTYQSLFRGAKKTLDSHLGWDPGALPLAVALARELGVPLIAATTTRLLVDLNRSSGHPARFGARVRGLPDAELVRIDRAYYRPYRNFVRALVAGLVRDARPVLQISLHSFTPVLRGQRRAADIGLLYDPSRRAERESAQVIRAELLQREPRLRIRRNYPYRGCADSLVAALRREHEAGSYLGLEVEVSQRFVRSSTEFAKLRQTVVDAIASAVRGALPPRADSARGTSAAL